MGRSEKLKVVGAIRSILLTEWDPNGIGENPSLADEYDSYLSAILACATQRQPEEAVYAVLAGIERDTQMPVAEFKRRAAAEAIAEAFKGSLPGR